MNQFCSVPLHNSVCIFKGPICVDRECCRRINHELYEPDDDVKLAKRIKIQLTFFECMNKLQESFSKMHHQVDIADRQDQKVK